MCKWNYIDSYHSTRSDMKFVQPKNKSTYDMLLRRYGTIVHLDFRAEVELKWSVNVRGVTSIPNFKEVSNDEC